MGSGLILLVIVGAWLAVLVPMALKSHDGATVARSADRFGDAMRVLSRRGPAREVPALDADLPAVEPLTWSARTAVLRERLEDYRASRPVLTAAQRRRRVLGTLVSVTVLGLAGSALAGWLLGVGLLGLALTAAYLVVLRACVLRESQRRLTREMHGEHRDEDWEGGWYAASTEVLDGGWTPDGRWQEPAAHRDDAEVGLDVLQQEPEVVVDLREPAPSPAARYEDPAPRSWDPVPVPAPTYLSAPPAPPRPQRTIDLTRVEEEAGTWVPPHARPVQEPEHDDVLERRRAVGGW